MIKIHFRVCKFSFFIGLTILAKEQERKRGENSTAACRSNEHYCSLNQVEMQRRVLQLPLDGDCPLLKNDEMSDSNSYHWLRFGLKLMQKPTTESDRVKEMEGVAVQILMNGNRKHYLMDTCDDTWVQDIITSPVFDWSGQDLTKMQSFQGHWVL